MCIRDRPEYVVEKAEKEFPEIVVCEFSEAMIQEIVEKYSAKKIARLISVGGNTNIYEINFNDVKIAI